MIYKLEIEDDSYIEVCVDKICGDEKGRKQILLHVADIHKTKEVTVENFINFQLSENSCRELIKCLRHAIEDIYLL